MASRDRDYMGGVAPPAGAASEPREFAWKVLIALSVLVLALYQNDAIARWLVANGVPTAEGLLKGRVWQVVVAPFLQVDLVHLGMTCAFLWLCGQVLERDKGAGFTLGLALLGGVATSLACAIAYGSGAAGSLAEGSGTGFFVSERFVVTNAHVVGQEREVELSIGPQGVVAKGRVKALHQQLDLALVEVDHRGKPLLYAEGTAAGDTVFALGYGVHSGQNRDLLTTKGTLSARSAEAGRMVFDGTVNPGNSGGPLVDRGGRWIGVVAAKSRTTGPNQATYGYAVDGAAALRWLVDNGCSAGIAKGPPTSETPPVATAHSVARIAVKQGAALRSEQAFNRHLTAHDPRVTGGSGMVWAFALFLLLRDPKRSVWLFGQYVPLLPVFLLYGIVDINGFLHSSASHPGLSHAYVLAGGGVGAFAHWLNWDRRFEALRRRWRLWRRNTGTEGPPPTIRFPDRTGASSPQVPEPSERGLSQADRERMDEILARISSDGIDSLTPEERSFLDRASKQLRRD